MGAVCLYSESNADGKKGILGLLEHPPLWQEVAGETIWRSLQQTCCFPGLCLILQRRAVEAWLLQGFPVQQEQDCGGSICQAGASPALPAAAFLGAASSLSGEVLSCLCGGFLEKLE